MNMTKPDSLYNQGMKLLLHSKIASQRRNIEWYRGGRCISYYRNQVQRKGFTFYTLTFTIDSKYNNDEIYIAADYPYTYSFMLQQMRGWCCQKTKQKAQSKILFKTSAGNDSPMIIITNYNSTEEEVNERQAIFFTGRVHPGY